MQDKRIVQQISNAVELNMFAFVVWIGLYCVDILFPVQP